MDKIVITIPKDIKNAKGNLGPLCNNCAGYGFTISIKDGKNLSCRFCEGTGVPKVDLVDLQRQVIELTRLVKMLYTELKAKGLTGIK